VHGLPPPSRQLSPPTKRSGTRGEGEARASDKAALFDFSDVERAMEVARVPQHVQREELLLFDFDVTLLPGAESWLRVNDGCSVAELRFFEPRCVGFFCRLAPLLSLAATEKPCAVSDRALPAPDSPLNCASGIVLVSQVSAADEVDGGGCGQRRGGKVERAIRAASRGCGNRRCVEMVRAHNGK
jgi:hypothetical protein